MLSPLATALLGADPGLTEYERWRNGRAEAHYEWSFNFGRLPRHEFAEPLYAGIASDERAGQDFRDVLTRRVDPPLGAAYPERRARWFAAAA